jgi:hypothetical protein
MHQNSGPWDEAKPLAVLPPQTLIRYPSWNMIQRRVGWINAPKAED